MSDPLDRLARRGGLWWYLTVALLFAASVGAVWLLFLFTNAKEVAL